MGYLIGKDISELRDISEKLGEKGYRGNQLYRWLYTNLILNFSDMKNLPKYFREKLRENYSTVTLTTLKIHTSEDGSKKYLFKLQDGYQIESVLIPERNWSTICISSQVGCGMGCKFCATGKMGFIRNLECGEILEQVIHIVKAEDLMKKRVNIVYMGMGEPLLNLDKVLKSYRIITDPDGMGISRRRVTISTCGIIPGIKKLSSLSKVPKLAVSLNASNNTVRNHLMPINKKYPLKEIIDVCKKIPLRKGERITFEYIMIDGINDSIKDAKELTKLLKPLRSKINLIPYNPIDKNFSPSPMEKILKFQNYLHKKGFTVTIRDSKGKDIKGACGMLATKNK